MLTKALARLDARSAANQHPFNAHPAFGSVLPDPERPNRDSVCTISIARSMPSRNNCTSTTRSHCGKGYSTGCLTSTHNGSLHVARQSGRLTKCLRPRCWKQPKGSSAWIITGRNDTGAHLLFLVVILQLLQCITLLLAISALNIAHVRLFAYPASPCVSPSVLALSVRSCYTYLSQEEDECEAPIAAVWAHMT